MISPNADDGDDRYFALLAGALRVCAQYKPRFGLGRGAGLSLTEFQQLYGADPFYSWLGLDSPLMYAAHRAAGGMTSIYRQIGIGTQWIFASILQDRLGLSATDAIWSYEVASSGAKPARSIWTAGSTSPRC